MLPGPHGAPTFFLQKNHRSDATYPTPHTLWYHSTLGLRLVSLNSRLESHNEEDEAHPVTHTCKTIPHTPYLIVHFRRHAERGCDDLFVELKPPRRTPCDTRSQDDTRHPKLETRNPSVRHRTSVCHVPHRAFPLTRQTRLRLYKINRGSTLEVTQ